MKLGREHSAVFQILMAMLHRLGGESLRQESHPVIIDATGLEPITTSTHFVNRRMRDRKK